LPETYRELKGDRPAENEPVAGLDTVAPVMEPEPIPPPEPLVEIEPELMVAAEAELELEVKPERVVAEVEPEVIVEPEPVQPEPKPKRKRAAKPKTKPEPEPESELTPDVKAEAVAELESAVAGLESAVAAESAEVKPKPKRRRKTAAVPEPTEKPETELVAETEPAPEVEPVMEAEPEPAPETEIEPVAEAEAEPAEPESELSPGLIEVSIEGLYSAFAADKEAADARYKGKMLKLTGLLYRTVINENLDVAYIILTSAKKFGDWKVSCTFSKEHEGELRQLGEEQMVTVQGNYDGYRANVQMRDCVLLR